MTALLSIMLDARDITATLTVTGRTGARTHYSLIEASFRDDEALEMVDQLAELIDVAKALKASLSFTVNDADPRLQQMAEGYAEARAKACRKARGKSGTAVAPTERQDCIAREIMRVAGWEYRDALRVACTPQRDLTREELELRKRGAIKWRVKRDEHRH